jgi:uncharacterized DUF497 family protein
VEKLEMRIGGILWLDAVVEKLAVKHHLQPEEVEEVFTGKPKYRFVQRGSRLDEDVYMALGQTAAGRYLTVLFIYKLSGEALILSARDMADRERRQYGRK